MLFVVDENLLSITVAKADLSDLNLTKRSLGRLPIFTFALSMSYSGMTVLFPMSPFVIHSLHLRRACKDPSAGGRPLFFRSSEAGTWARTTLQNARYSMN